VKLIASLLLLVACGCTQTPRLQPIVIDWSDFSQKGVREWTDQIAAKQPASVILFCHGEDEPGRWNLITKPDLEQIDTKAIGYTLKRLYHRDVYLVSCNVHGQRLNVPGVFYAPRVVWQTPGPQWRIVSMHGNYTLVRGVGDVSEFVEGKPNQ
jgi:hypothetical protein